MSIQYQPDELWVIVPQVWYEAGQGNYWERSDSPLKKIYTSQPEALSHCGPDQTTVTVQDCVHQMLFDRLQWAKGS